jgi:membrane-associated phospholipid phosphatase
VRVEPEELYPTFDFPDFAERQLGVKGRPLLWNPAWPKFSTSEWIVTGTSLVTSVTAAIIGTSRSRPWIGGIGIDGDVRKALRLDSLQHRRTARDISDALLTLSLSYPMIDSILVAGWYRRSPDIAWEMTLMNLEVYMVVAGITSLAKLLGQRERPYGRSCGTIRPEATRDCNSDARYFSFFSGHSASSFAAAAVNCTHHHYLRLYGGGWGDVVSCVGGFTAAAVTASLRVMSDVHYFSDVAIGAAVGTLVGVGLPWLFHYRHGSRTRPGAHFVVRLVPMHLGAAAVGRF